MERAKRYKDMKHPVTKIGGGSAKVVPNRKPHKVMSIPELVAKVEKQAGIVKAQKESLKDIAKKMGL